jgi:prefoldin beta subunit
MSETEIPPQIKEQLSKLQQMQQTLQTVVSQKQQLEIELKETEKAISELEKVTDDSPVYKMVGGIMVKAVKKDLLIELIDRKELLNTRVTVLGKQEERARNRVKEIQENLQQHVRTN